MKAVIRICVLALATLYPYSGAFVSPSTTLTRERSAARYLRMSIEPSTSSSRRGFIHRAGNVASVLGLTVLGTCAVPDSGMAKDFAGFDIRGIETAEVLHPGIGGGGWRSKATKPLRDCVVNVERVRVTTKQERTMSLKRLPNARLRRGRHSSFVSLASDIRSARLGRDPPSVPWGGDLAESCHQCPDVGRFTAHEMLSPDRCILAEPQLEDDLTNKGAPPGLAGLVKGLVKNYRLDESLTQGALYIESTKDRAAAASAGKEALEYLAQTVEYFPPEVDQRTGLVKTTLSAEALEFTVNALVATREKLDIFLSKIPSEAVQEARAELATERKGM